MSEHLACGWSPAGDAYFCFHGTASLSSLSARRRTRPGRVHRCVGFTAARRTPRPGNAALPGVARLRLARPSRPACDREPCAPTGGASGRHAFRECPCACLGGTTCV
eukprot:scaffold2159_cov112-Isochrysis_galbana.AAC.3